MDRRTMETEDADNSCSICLQAFKREAYLTSCYHKFCYDCLIEWYNTKARQHTQPPALTSVECPLCKGVSVSLAHNYDGAHFDIYFFDPHVKSLILSDDHKLRLETYHTSQSAALAHRFNVKKFWKLKRFLQPNRFLNTWLKRELECLMRMEDKLEVVLHHVLGTIEDFCKKFKLRKAAVNPEETESMFKGVIAQATEKFIKDKAERFAEELVIFLASEMTLEAYDDVCRRKPSNWSENLTSWVEDKIESLLLQKGNRRRQADSCIQLARSVKSIGELKLQLVKRLRFPSNANTGVFSKILFDRIFVKQRDSYGSGSGSSNRRF